MGNDKSWWRNAKDKIEGQIETQKAAKSEREAEYGHQTASHMFGTKWVHIYSKGYVQVRDAVALKSSAPFERLLAIDSQADVTKKSGFGRGAAAVVTAGANLSSSNMRGDVYLTIGTDKTTHALRAKPTTESVRAAKALEVAGKAAIAAANTRTATSTATPPTAVQPDAADQLKKLADLHAAGILTDDEFAAKKADLLDRM